MSTTRWTRKRTVQAELDRLYEAYFEQASEASMANAYIKDLHDGTLQLPTKEQHTMASSISLGGKYLDPISGLTLTATGVAEYLHGETRVQLEGPSQDGHPLSYWVSESQLQVDRINPEITLTGISINNAAYADGCAELQPARGWGEPSPETLRLECLKLANADVETARALAEFILAG